MQNEPASPVWQAGDFPYDVGENGSSVKFLVTIFQTQLIYAWHPTKFIFQISGEVFEL